MKKNILPLFVGLALSAVAIAQDKGNSLEIVQSDNASSVLRDAKQSLRKSTPEETVITFGDSNQFVLGITSQHQSQSSDFCFLHIPDTSLASKTFLRERFPVFYSEAIEPCGQDNFSCLDWSVGSPNLNDGFLFLSPIDAFRAGVDYRGSWETWVRTKAPINTQGWDIVDIFINQTLVRYNRDSYFVDWSSDSSFAAGTYNSIPFNLKATSPPGTLVKEEMRITLPLATSINQDSLYIRLRFKGIADAIPSYRREPVGSYWIVDNLRIKNGDDSRLEILPIGTNSGVYFSIPKGLNIEALNWVSWITNSGAQKLTDVHLLADIFSASGSDAAPTLNFLQRAEGPKVDINPPTDSMRISMFSVHDRQNPSFLPTNQSGKLSLNYQAKLQKASGDSLIIPIDSVLITISDATTRIKDSDIFRWSKAMTLLTHNASWKYGQTTYGFSENGPYNHEGYSICVRYGTGEQDPDNPWYIRGVEVVSAADASQAETIIQASIKKQNPLISNPRENPEQFITPVLSSDGTPLLSAEYTVKNEDLNNGITSNSQPYTDNYNSIFLEFPESVMLEDNTSYYACFSLLDNQEFVVASEGESYIGSGLNPFNLLIYSPGIGNQPSSGNPINGLFVGQRIPLISLMLSPSPYVSLQTTTPKPTSLLEIYPNPANQQTKIKYALNRTAKVSIEIRDVMGKVLLVIPQGVQTEATLHEVEINTSHLPCGVYFYSIDVDGIKETKKLLIVR